MDKLLWLIHGVGGGASSRSHLSAGGVDADGVVQQLFGDATLDGHTEALGYLTRIRTQVVEPYHPVLYTHTHTKPLASRTIFIHVYYTVNNLAKMSHDLHNSC